MEVREEATASTLKTLKTPAGPPSQPSTLQNQQQRCWLFVSQPVYDTFLQQTDLGNESIIQLFTCIAIQDKKHYTPCFG